MRSIILFLTIFHFAGPALQGQEWIVPDDKKGRLSTFEFDDNTRTAGQKIYTLNCMSCHGTPGKSNYLNLVPPPGDPATEKIQKNNDGELFYKITTGKGQMPSFRSVLTTDEVWQVIAYVRSYNKTYKQQIRAIISSSAYPGATINMSLEHNHADSTLILTAFADKEDTRIPVTDAAVRLYVHRTFGHQIIDEEKVTDKTGRATFRIPPQMHGDSLGNVTISARFTDEDTFGSAYKDTLLTAGLKIIPVSLVADRAMWNTVRKAPVWILLSYILGVITAWGFIMLVLMKIRDIYIVGKHLESASSENQDT